MCELARKTRKRVKKAYDEKVNVCCVKGVISSVVLRLFGKRTRMPGLGLTNREVD